MTNQQQPQPPQFGIAELGAKFGAQLGQAYAEIITMEKQLSAQALTVQQMTANEAALVDHIQVLEAELAELKATIGTLMAEPYRELADNGVVTDVSPMAEAAAAIASQVEKTKKVMRDI